MNQPNNDPRAALRRSIYLLLAVIALGAVIGRILAVDSVDRTAVEKDLVKRRIDEKRADLAKRFKGDEFEERFAAAEKRIRATIQLSRPFLSGNDRSRWCTVRALVEPEMRVEGAPYSIDKVVQEPNWDTIDMIKHDGHLYSSKPTLLPTLMAAEYWVIHRLTGWSLATHPYEVGRLMLITINGGCLLLYFWALARLVERLGTTDWGRVFVMAAGVFGTLLTTFAVVINNHLVAAAFAALALEALLRIWLDGERRPVWFAVAGLAAAFMAANELPAAALAAPISLAVLWKAWRPTLWAYVPAAALVTVGFFGTNWIAHGCLKPAYMHRGGTDNWYDYTYERGGRTIESHWNHPTGIDRGEPNTVLYTLHATVGHHGILSLTPVWLMSVCGTIVWLRRGRDGRRELAMLVAVVSAVCLAFYLWSPSVDRNYGGTSSAFRWVFWMAPMWLCVMLPVADATADRRVPRWIAVVLLGLSMISTTYPTWNPWTHPWFMDFMMYLGWVKLP